MKKIFFIVLVFVSQFLFAQKDTVAEKFGFDGYIQIRATSNFDNYTSFSVRRLKLWIKSKPEFSKHWEYKIQTTFSSYSQEKFFLQDVKLKYKAGLLSFDIGQFVPQYSLQRFQHDYEIAPLERAKVINTLIPDGTLGVRDIGLQANFKTKNKLFASHLGIFNGYGIKEYRFKNTGFMISHKTAIDIPIEKTNFKIGYSIQYRKAENLMIPKVLPDTFFFTGNDFRYNVFAMFKSPVFKLQAEYLTADFDGQRAYGFYVLSVIKLKKNQFVLAYENYTDLIDETDDSPYLRLGYNYLVKEYKFRVSFDNYFQLSQGKIGNYLANIQLQFFLR